MLQAGEERASGWAGDPALMPFGYAGGMRDDATGDVHFGAREYDPWLGRWISKDPILFAGGDANLYAYVGGDPVNFVDPTGLAVYIGGHPAFYNRRGNPLYHAAIILSPDNMEDFAGDQLFGTYGSFATLGGQAGGQTEGAFCPPPFGCLTYEPNFPGDHPCELGLDTLVAVEPPAGMSDSEFIRRLIAAANSYGDNVTYSPVPVRWMGTRNSNSFVSGVINHVLGYVPDAPPVGVYPGWGTPLDLPNTSIRAH